METRQPDSAWDRQHRMQRAAYALWQQRGCPLWTAEVDWFQAEEQLAKADEEAAAKPTLVTVAEAIGSALGSVAGRVASAVGLVPSEE